MAPGPVDWRGVLDFMCVAPNLELSLFLGIEDSMARVGKAQMLRQVFLFGCVDGTPLFADVLMSPLTEQRRDLMIRSLRHLATVKTRIPRGGRVGWFGKQIMMQ